jgi:Type VI secretion system effector, Hcp
MVKANKPSDLTKGSSPKTSPELNERELDKVSGGANDFLLTLDGIKGESQDDKHKDTIEVMSFKTK